MELIISLSAFLLFCFMIVKIIKKSMDKNSILKLPPGPKPLPFIGNMHQLFGSRFHHLLRDLAKKYGPLMHLKLGEASTIIVTSPEMAQEVFKTKDILFSNRPSDHLAFKILSYNFSGFTFSPYGNHWRQLRKICTMELFSPKRVQTFKSMREDEVFNLIKVVFSQKGSIINLSKSLFSLTYSITSRAAFGKINKDTETYIHLTDQINKLASGFSLADMYPSNKLLQVMSTTGYKMGVVHKQADRILGNILNEHKEKIKEAKQENGEANEDVVDVLLNIQQRGDFEPQLTDTIIKASVLDIFSGGGETSATAMEWAVSEMIKNPQIMKRAQEEVRNVFDERGNVDESRLHEFKYLHAIIKETLRLHPSLPLLLPRECVEQCQINGYDIPAKARILVNAWAIGRDSNYWNEAEKFNPSRFLDSEIDYIGKDFEYIPFGAGRRICPGISFSQPIVALLLAQLLFHFDWKLPGDLKPEELDMTESLGVAVRRKNDLHLIPLPYNRSCLRMEN